MHTAELTLLKNNNDNDNNGNPQITGVGEMVQAELSIHHTRQWCPAPNRESPDRLEFSYEILCHADTWLVGGRRRGNFSCAEGERRMFRILLLPQRPGHVLLPTVDVKSFVSTEGGEGGGPQRQQVTSEVDYRNHAETILVTSNKATTTVELGEFGQSPSQSQSQSQSHEGDKRVSIATG